MLRHSLPTNTNLSTGIAYGYIAANTLDPDIVNDLQMNGTDVNYEDAKVEYQHEKARSSEVILATPGWLHATYGTDFVNTEVDYLRYVKENWDDFEQEFNDSYNPDEPIHEGEKDGVKYRTSWLGGALNVWIFESPFTGRFRPCSPCVPGAADLNSPDDDGIEGYTVPPDWLATQE